jgi:hypothetical protein
MRPIRICAAPIWGDHSDDWWPSKYHVCTMCLRERKTPTEWIDRDEG